MIRHLVMFKLREFSTPEEKMKAAETVRTELSTMKKKIPEIQEFEVGINFTIDDAAYDLVINSSFSSKEDLKTYQVHPDHQDFIKFNKNYSAKKVVLDYEY
jgi:Stress responsive A/B Barrel Domain